MYFYSSPTKLLIFQRYRFVVSVTFQTKLFAYRVQFTSRVCVYKRRIIIVHADIFLLFMQVSPSYMIISILLLYLCGALYNNIIKLDRLRRL